MSVCIARLSVYRVFTAREGQNWSYRWLGTVKQALGIKARPSAEVLLLTIPQSLSVY